MRLGERGEERKEGGGERALSSYTSWHSPEPRKASKRFIHLLWKDTLMRRTLGLEAKSVPNEKQCAGNGGKTREIGVRSQPRGALFAAPACRGQPGDFEAGDACFAPRPPHMGEDPRQVRHRDARTAIESRAPCRVYPAVTAADVPRGWRCPYTCLPLPLYPLPKVSKVCRSEVESAGDKDNQPLRLG